ncbi:TPA: MarC family protein [Candidatus Woesearchaeota archaeon]|nr:MarC family protein [Candidatus Woesearchaeota archaeon]HIH32476.1 MarC family protein [Candidatus Woesearchaeota archaeon]HIH54261.1 MarC family protein [Candidatus Woesearchaeota archaeon]HIJ02599.1 MarC family protein [Candidatus Woesearchaeota archaeon]HIJ13862.1 MarC family protein [Candidatus Woesearchaeota archaeon]
MFEEFLRSFITLFIIMDPFVSVVFFLGYSKSLNQKQKNNAVLIAISVAAILLFIFLVSGLFLLNTLGISFNGFKVAGGIILLIMGITTVLAIDVGSKTENVHSGAILIGTPLLSGPGALTTIIILSKDYGYFIPALAAIAVLIVSYLALKFAVHLQKLIGTKIIEILSKVLGLLLAALAVDFIHSGIVGFMG